LKACDSLNNRGLRFTFLGTATGFKPLIACKWMDQVRSSEPPHTVATCCGLHAGGWWGGVVCRRADEGRIRLGPRYTIEPCNRCPYQRAVLLCCFCCHGCCCCCYWCCRCCFCCCY
jgi:hypothetical protein